MEESPGQRLALFRKEKHLSQREVASALGFSPGRIGSIESGSAVPSQAFLRSVAEVYGISADWLLYGKGAMIMPYSPASGGGGGNGDGSHDPRIDPHDYGKPMHGVVVLDGVEYTRVRRLALNVSAGNGLGPAEDGTADALLVPRDWMMRQRLAPDLTVLVRVSGDSMAPGLPDGSLIFVSVGERLELRPGVWAMTLADEALVKRVAITSSAPDGTPTSVLLISDNPAYPPRALSGDQLSDLRVAGRVRGVFALF